MNSWVKFHDYTTNSTKYLLEDDKIQEKFTQEIIA